MPQIAPLARQPRTAALSPLPTSEADIPGSDSPPPQIFVYSLISLHFKIKPVSSLLPFSMRRPAASR